MFILRRVCVCVCGSKEENKHTRIFFYMKINISSERCFRFIRRACGDVVIHFAEYYAVETKPTAPTPPHHPPLSEQPISVNWVSFVVCCAARKGFVMMRKKKLLFVGFWCHTYRDRKRYSSELCCFFIFWLGGGWWH